MSRLGLRTPQQSIASSCLYIPRVVVCLYTQNIHTQLISYEYSTKTMNTIPGIHHPSWYAYRNSKGWKHKHYWFSITGITYCKSQENLATRNNIYLMIRNNVVCMPCTNAHKFLRVASCSVQFLVEGWSLCWHKFATVRGAGTSWMSLQPWRKFSRTLHSNKWKPVLVLQKLTKTFLSDSLLRHILDYFRHCFRK